MLHDPLGVRPKKPQNPEKIKAGEKQVKSRFPGNSESRSKVGHKEGFQHENLFLTYFRPTFRISRKPTFDLFFACFDFFRGFGASRRPATSQGQTLQTLEKQALWHGHPAQTSMKKNSGCVFRSLSIPPKIAKTVVFNRGPIP